MRKLILIAAGVLMLSPVAAFAQVEQHSSSNSGAGAEAIIENNNPGSGSSGGFENRYGDTPSAIAPTMYSADSCANEAAGSASFLGIGISAGISGEVKGCVQRQWFILMETTAMKTGNAGYGQWATDIACATPAIAAQAPAGMCPGSAPAAPQIASVAYVRPTPVYVPRYASPAPVQKPDYCYTISKGDPIPPACR